MGSDMTPFALKTNFIRLNFRSHRQKIIILLRHQFACTMDQIGAVCLCQQDHMAILWYTAAMSRFFQADFYRRDPQDS